MSFPGCKRTLFVLDHGPNFAKSSGLETNVDVVANKSKQTNNQIGIIPLPPVSKSMWTSSVESLLEYCRITWDILPRDAKLCAFVNGSHAPERLNSWAIGEQNLKWLSRKCAKIGPPSAFTNRIVNLTNVMQPALCALVEPLPDEGIATNVAKSFDNPMCEISSGKGRLIIISQFENEDTIATYLDKIASSTARLPANQRDTLKQLDVLFVHTQPSGCGTQGPGSCPVRKLPPNTVTGCQISYEVVDVGLGRNLLPKFLQLVQRHFDLISTTITGIPMKEEAHAGSSTNYDVELLHPRVVHAGILGDEDVLRVNTRDPTVEVGLPDCGGGPAGVAPYDTVSLKWVMPKFSNVELQHCTGAYTVSPVEVHSRQSTCLTNFLLLGRTVMLEQVKKKVASHMLTSHAGDIYIHVMGHAPGGVGTSGGRQCRSLVDDPPSITEGLGGKVSDYRLEDMRSFMKEHILLPLGFLGSLEKKGSAPGAQTITPAYKAICHMDRATKYWPLVNSDTVICSLAHVQPILRLLVQETLSEEDVAECKRAVYTLATLERKEQPLPVAGGGGATPPGAAGKKASKRVQEQYLAMWNELEAASRAYSASSREHAAVLQYVQENRQHSPPGGGGSGGTTGGTTGGATGGASGDVPAAATGAASLTVDVKTDAKGSHVIMDLPPASPPSESPTKKRKLHNVELLKNGRLVRGLDILNEIYKYDAKPFAYEENLVNGKVKLYADIQFSDPPKETKGQKYAKMRARENKQNL